MQASVLDERAQRARAATRIRRELRHLGYDDPSFAGLGLEQLLKVKRAAVRDLMAPGRQLV